MQIRKFFESSFSLDNLDLSEYVIGYKKDNIKIDSHKYKLFLENKGFAKHYPNGSDKPMFVYVKENKVKESSISRIKDFVLNYLLENGKIDAAE